MISHQPLWFQDLAACSLQVASIVIMGSLLPPILRLRIPKLRLAYWQALLATCLLLPLIQPWRSEWPAAERLGVVSRLSVGGPVAVQARFPFADAVLGFLLAGIFLRLLWTVLGALRLRAYQKHAHPLQQETTPILDAQALAGVRPAVYLSEEVASPATFGSLSPVILLPHRFFELPAAQQKAIACHEFLHVARHDWAWNIAEELVLSFLWFHPAIWWLVKNIRLSREQTVDGEVIRLTSSRRAYLGALLAIAQPKTESIRAPLFLIESQLVQRVTLIAKEIKMSRFRLIASLFLTTAILFFVGSAAVSSFPLYAPASAAIPLLSAGHPAAPWASGDSFTGMNEKIYKVGKSVKAPRPIQDPQPAYTRLARRAKLIGTAVFSVVVDAKGRVEDVRETSKPLGLGLDQSAIKTIGTWKFTPAQRKGKPVAVRVHIEVTFMLN